MSLKNPIVKSLGRALLAAASVGLVLLFISALPIGRGLAFYLVAGAAVAIGSGYLVWQANSAMALSFAAVASVFAGNWSNLGLPDIAAPDRLLLFGVVVAVVLHSPGSEQRPRFEMRPVHWMLIVVATYAIVSAILAGTIGQRADLFRMIDRLGLMPFIVFAIAPLVFYDTRRRGYLIAGLVALGAYLGITAFFEVVGPQALVFPPYIGAESLGTHFGRARGPFVEAAINGSAMFTCGVACVIALKTWTGQWSRVFAFGVLGLCGLGLVLTLTRSVWLGSAVATLITFVAVRDLRRYAVPVVVSGAILVLGALLVIPGLRAEVEERNSEVRSIWVRENMNVAAMNMTAEHPLFGAGWGKFREEGVNYFWQTDVPLVFGNDIHNVFLANLAELGLVGTALWLLAFAMAIGTALSTRGPPELELWRAGLLAIAVFWLILASFVPLPAVFPTLILWLWAGVVHSWRLAPRAAVAP